MKAIYLVLALIGCAVPIHGAGHAASSDPASQQQSSESSAAPLSSDHASAAWADDRSQKNGILSDERAARRRTSDKNHSRGRSTLTKPNRPKQLRNSRERSTSKTAMSVRQSSPTRRAAGTAKITNNRNLPAHTTGFAGLSGQQFKNPHNRGATPATVGGPAGATRRTAAIDGTGVKRRRSN